MIVFDLPLPAELQHAYYLSSTRGCCSTLSTPSAHDIVYISAFQAPFSVEYLRYAL